MATRAKELADFIGTGALSPALKLQDDAGGEFVGLDAPATVSASFTLTMPGSDGTNGQALVTDGSGNLSFGDAGISTGKAIAMAIVFG